MKTWCWTRKIYICCFGQIQRSTERFFSGALWVIPVYRDGIKASKVIGSAIAQRFSPFRLLLWCTKTHPSSFVVEIVALTSNSCSIGSIPLETVILNFGFLVLFHRCVKEPTCQSEISINICGILLAFLNLNLWGIMEGNQGSTTQGWFFISNIPLSSAWRPSKAVR